MRTISNKQSTPRTGALRISLSLSELYHAYFLRFRFWVKAEAAADFAAFDDEGLLNTFAALEAAAALVSFVVLRWASADPAADFAALLEPELLRVFEAADAARLLVFSVFRAIYRTPWQAYIPVTRQQQKENIMRAPFLKEPTSAI